MGSWKVGNQFCVKRSFELYQEFHNPRKSICNDGNLFSSNNRACFFFFESIWPMILLTLCHLDTFWYVASLKLFSHSLKHTVRLHCHDQANLFDIFWLLMRFWIWEFLLVWHFPMRRLFWPFHCCYSIKFLWSYFYSFVKKRWLQIIGVNIIPFEEVFFDLFFFCELIRFHFISERFWTFKTNRESLH